MQRYKYRREKQITPSTIDHINNLLKVYHDDFTRIAEDIKQTTDLKEKRQMVVSLLTLCFQYEMLDQQGEVTECLIIAWDEQIELCKKSPKDGEMHMNLCVMSLMNAYMAYQHNEIDAAITFCLTFA